MSRFLVVTFPDPTGAQHGMATLRELAQERLVQLHVATTVTKAKDGKLSMHVALDDAPAMVATGAMIGALAGLAMGPIAAAILAAGGAVFGASAAMTSRGSVLAFTEKIAHRLARSTAAVVADVATEDLSTLATRLEAIGGTVTRWDERP